MTVPEDNAKTVGQAEREITQRMRSLYKKKLGHKVSDVTCQIFDEKLAIVVEDALTKVEERLLENGEVALTEQVRKDLNESIEPQVEEIVEGALNVDVVDILKDTSLDSGTSGIIALLSDAPHLRQARRRTSSHHPAEHTEQKKDEAETVWEKKLREKSIEKPA